MCAEFSENALTVPKRSVRSRSAQTRRWYNRGLDFAVYAVPATFRRSRSQTGTQEKYMMNISRHLVGAIAIHAIVWRVRATDDIASFNDEVDETSGSDFSNQLSHSSSDKSLSSADKRHGSRSSKSSTEKDSDSISRHLKQYGGFLPPKKSVSESDITDAQLQRMFPELAANFRKALAKSPIVQNAVAEPESGYNGISKHQTLQYWQGDKVKPADHIWLAFSGAGTTSDTECFLGERDCKRSGEKRRCAVCHTVAHSDCIERLPSLGLHCRTTYRDAEDRRQAELTAREQHHWIHRWKLQGKCLQCHKGFQQKRFREKELIGVTCTWCKEVYHNKPECFSQTKLVERCHMGVYHDLIVPPFWITRKACRQHDDPSKKPKPRKFVAKPVISSIPGPKHPLLVFVNPKSGGNKQGAKTLHKLCWLLNPRQIFDITAMGPKYGLEVYKSLNRSLWIVVCGGDGTVGWVLSTLDELEWPFYPPIAVLPMGTGNDLARTLGWGGSFNNDSINNYLESLLYEATVTELDRWKLEVEPNWDCILSQTEIFNEHEQASLPLNVMNNYFSIGADAHVALQFHQSRSANPQMLNSRLRNRIAYGGLGTINLFKRTWKDLSDFVKLECDGKDYTPVVRANRFHCLLFHNITYYAGGTTPWSNDNDDGCTQSFSDGKIEVIGFTTAQLAALQMGGRGERIVQCSKVHLVTFKTIPMQVDGEPCLLSPSSIVLTFHNKVSMLQRTKGSTATRKFGRSCCSSPELYMSKHVSIARNQALQDTPVFAINRKEYETGMKKAEDLIDIAYELGRLHIETDTTLEAVRPKVQDLLLQHPCLPSNSDDNWEFLDYIAHNKKSVVEVSRVMEANRRLEDVCIPATGLIVVANGFPPLSEHNGEESATVSLASRKQSDLTIRSMCQTNGVVSAVEYIMFDDNATEL